MKIAFRKTVAAAVLLSTAAAFFLSPMYDLVKLAFLWANPISITEFRLRYMDTGQIVEKVEEAIAEEDFDDASNMIEVAQEYGHQFDPDLIARSQESIAGKSWRYGRDFAAGFATGYSGSLPGIMGSMAADYSVVGDVRDIMMEGQKAVRGEDYDLFVLGLSLFGLSTVVPGSGPADIGASVVKTAKRAGYMSAGITRVLGRSARNLIDIDALKAALSELSEAVLRMPAFSELMKFMTSISKSGFQNFDFADFRKKVANLVPVDVAAVQQRFSRVLRPGAAKEVREFVSSAASIANTGGPKAALRSMKIADTPAELARIKKLAHHAGDKTSSILRLLGKGAIKLGKLLYKMIAAFIYALAWLVGAIWSIVSFGFNLRMLLR